MMLLLAHHRYPLPMRALFECFVVCASCHTDVTQSQHSVPTKPKVQNNRSRRIVRKAGVRRRRFPRAKVLTVRLLSYHNLPSTTKHTIETVMMMRVLRSMLLAGLGLVVISRLAVSQGETDSTLAGLYLSLIY